MIESEKLLNAYGEVSLENKDSLAGVYERLAAKENYKLNYVAVNRHLDGSNPVPVLNKLVIIAEKRAFDIQKFDYADRFVMFNRLDESTGTEGVANEVSDFFKLYKECRNDMNKKLRLFCKFSLSNEARERIISLVDEKTRSYYSMGVDKIRAASFNVTLLAKVISSDLIDYDTRIYQEFKEGDKLSKASIKSILQQIYSDLGSHRRAKASDLEEWFELKSRKIKVESTGKWEHGFELVKKIK
jgi:hypothetical protein